MYLSRVKERNSHTQGSKHSRAETTEKNNNKKLDNLPQDNGPHNLSRNSMSGICERSIGSMTFRLQNILQGHLWKLS